MSPEGVQAVNASVVLPVRNGAVWIEECLQSLRVQTRQDFEIILIDHQSEDRTVELATSMDVPQLRIVRSDGPTLGDVLAAGVLEARSDVIIRMDVDDIALPWRIESQVELMSASPSLVACGSWAWQEQARLGHQYLLRTPTTDAQLRSALYLGNPFLHSSMALRRSAVLAAGNYRSDGSPEFPEDLDLWLRLVRYGTVLVTRRPGVVRRTHPHSQMYRLGVEINTRAGDLVREYWASSDRPSVRAAASLAPLFTNRDRRISARECATLYRGMFGIRSVTGWTRGFGAWGGAVWSRPLAWWLLRPGRRGAGLRASHNKQAEETSHAC